MSSAWSRSAGEGSRLQAAPRVGREEDQPADALRVAGGVGDGHRAALRHAQQREALEARGVDDGFEVSHPRLEREVLDVAIREPAPALVVAQDGVRLAQRGPPVPPDRALPVVLEVREPRGRLRTSGGPWPWIAYAMRTPSGAVQKRMSCDIASRVSPLAPTLCRG